MSRQQDVMRAFEFLIEILKDKEVDTSPAKDVSPAKNTEPIVTPLGLLVETNNQETNETITNLFGEKSTTAAERIHELICKVEGLDKNKLNIAKILENQEKTFAKEITDVLSRQEEKFKADMQRLKSDYTQKVQKDVVSETVEPAITIGVINDTTTSTTKEV